MRSSTLAPPAANGERCQKTFRRIHGSALLLQMARLRLMAHDQWRFGSTDAREARTQPTPTARIIDSQKCENTESGGPRGFDMAKKVKGASVTSSPIPKFAARSLRGRPQHQDNHGAVHCCGSSAAYPWTALHLADRVYQGPNCSPRSPIWANGPLKSSPFGERGNVQAEPRRWVVDVRLPGSAATDGSPKTSRHPLPAPKLGPDRSIRQLSRRLARPD